MLNANLQIIATTDGSATLFNPILNETYHSRHGALTESRYVFIRHGLEKMAEIKSHIRILEVGIGTGLNAALSAIYAQNNALTIDYVGLEPNPIPSSIINNYFLTENENNTNIEIPELKRLMVEIAKMPEANQIKMLVSDTFKFEYHRLGILNFESNSPFDLVYFDAFAPSKCPEMWTYEVLAKTASFLANGGLFVTYAATGHLRRTLADLCLTVQRLKGAPGKRHMVRAFKA